MLPGIVCRVQTILGHDLGNFWTYEAMVVVACVPWLSVTNPLVTILFVERYRQFVGGMLRGHLNRVDPTSSQQQRNQQAAAAGIRQVTPAQAKPPGGNLAPVNTIPPRIP